MSTVVLCETIQELGIRRKFCIKLANKQTNAAKSLARRYCGFAWDADEAERARINKRAGRIVDNFLAGKRPHSDDVVIAASIEANMRATADSMIPLIARRKEVEKEMAKLAKQLPAYDFVKGVKGLGEVGFPVIIAEAGNLSNYANIRMLWKRLGLAPYDGKAMSNWHGKDLTADEWTAMGYSPRRRAEMHACVAEPMIKFQLVSAKKSETDFGAPKGPYGESYIARRTHCLSTHPDWPRKHLHDDAMRFMTKALLKDLWAAWCHAEGIELPADRWAVAAE